MLKLSFLLRFFFFLSDVRTAFWALPAFLMAFPLGWGGIFSAVFTQPFCSCFPLAALAEGLAVTTVRSTREIVNDFVSSLTTPIPEATCPDVAREAK
uniref:Uncharacterized protein n=1 Tax=Ixodes scapularis TaxID=6945 RepID=A0A4D5RCE9_IXOSC